MWPSASGIWRSRSPSIRGRWASGCSLTGPVDRLLDLGGLITEHPGEPPDGEPIKLDQIGISHLSFTVPSVAQLTQQLLAKGYHTAGPPDAFQDQSGRVRTVFFFDPDGILVQFDEGN